MYQNWSRSKLYIEALINDQHEIHIKNIFKTTLKNYLIHSFLSILEKVYTKYIK